MYLKIFLISLSARPWLQIFSAAERSLVRVCPYVAFIPALRLSPCSTCYLVDCLSTLQPTVFMPFPLGVSPWLPNSSLPPLSCKDTSPWVWSNLSVLGLEVYITVPGHYLDFAPVFLSADLRLIV